MQIKTVLKKIMVLIACCFMFNSHLFLSPALAHNHTLGQSDGDTKHNQGNIIDAQIQEIKAKREEIERENIENKIHTKLEKMQMIQEKMRMELEEIAKTEREKPRNKLAKKLYKNDRKFYDIILKIVIKLFGPVFFEKASRGGQARIDAGARILDKLIKIHIKKEYCSSIKIDKLKSLIKEASSQLKELDAKDKLPNNIPVSTVQSYCPKVQELVDEIKTGKVTSTTSTVGGNFSFGVFWGAGCGAAIGWSTNSFGIRRLAVDGQLDAAMLTGLSMMGGLYQYDRKTNGDRLHQFMTPEDACKSAGLLGGFTYGYGKKEGKENSDYKILEFGIDAGFHIFKGFFFGGIDLFRLPCDLKVFRKNIGLTWESGVLPAEYEPVSI
jgi:hypothetical protein